MDHLGCTAGAKGAMIYQSWGIIAELKQNPLRSAAVKRAIVDPELGRCVITANVDRVLAFESNSADAGLNLIAVYSEQRITSTRICQRCRRNTLSSDRHSTVYGDTC
jgi:hypothetical protein